MPIVAIRHRRAALILPWAIAAAIAVTGCAKGKQDHDHDHDHDGHRHDVEGGAHAHVHGADGRVVYLQREAQAAGLAKAAAEMAGAAEAFLASLQPDQRGQAAFELSDDERQSWNFVPMDRKGLPLKAMTPQQRDLAHALLKSGLSTKGFVSATSIMSLETILADIEKNPRRRDPERYFVAVFGKPEASGTWGWRFEGHHLSLNFTLVNGQAISGSPAFLGSNPGQVRQGDRKGTRVLADEEDRGREFVMSLSDEQKKTAILPGPAPKEVLTGNSRKADIGEAKGIAYGDLKSEQQQALLAMIGHYAGRLREEMAAHDLDAIKAAGLDKLRFAWMGSTDPGQGHYYRIHGPTFLVEYDNTQDNANHVHTVWRDLSGRDFGVDPLKAHYDQHTGDKAHGHDQ